jgi:protein-disulfide isomerase
MQLQKGDFMQRRRFLSGLAAALAAPDFARAQEAELSPLPAGLDPQACPGLSWAGSGPQAIEIFDYNCPYCRAVFRALDSRVEKAGALRLGLIDSPLLSIGSIQAAKLRQAVLKLYGPKKAYAWHRNVFAGRGAIDGDVGLAAVKALGLDVAKTTDAADGDGVRDILVAQSRFLDRAGARATPSFILGGNLLSGWPGEAKFDAALKGA